MAAIFRDDVEYYFAGPASYNNVVDHPTINGVELVGDLTLEDLGLDTAKKVIVNPTPEEQANMNFWIEDDDEE